MIIIVTDRVQHALEELGDDLTGFRRCRMAGKLNGVPCRVVSAKAFPNNVRGLNITGIRPIRAKLTEDQRRFIAGESWKARI